MQRLQTTTYEFYLTVVVMVAVPQNTLSVSYIGIRLYIFFLIYFHEAPTESKYYLYCKLQDFPEFSVVLNCNLCFS